MVRGSLIHIPRNFLVALQGVRLTSENMSLFAYYGAAIISQTLAYPFLTVQRRKELLTKSDRLAGRGLSSASA